MTSPENCEVNHEARGLKGDLGCLASDAGHSRGLFSVCAAPSANSGVELRLFKLCTHERVLWQKEVICFNDPS